MRVKNLKFDIGAWVKFDTQMVRNRSYTDQKVCWKPDKTPLKKGQVVGITQRFSGIIDKETRIFLVDKSNFFYEVKLDWRSKPVFVREEDLTLCSFKEIEELPWIYRRRTWTEKEKQQLREDVLGCPRNENGQWIKG